MPDTSDGQFYVTFNGTDYGAGVEIRATHQDFALLRLETIISDPDFWT